MKKYKHMKDEKERSSTASIVTSLIFAVILFGLSIFCIIAPDRTFSSTENRALQSLPKFSFSNLFKGKFTPDFESYVQDQFIGRDTWIYAKNEIELLMQKSEINNIFIGKDNYYIENHSKSSYITDIASGNKTAISSFANIYSEKLGADKVSVMIVPTSQTVMTNKLPALATPYDQNEFIDDLKSKLPDGVFVDTYNALYPHNDEYIYYRTDHHWTSLGAYYGYTAWAEQKGLSVNTLDSYDKKQLTTDFLGTVNSKLNLPMQSDIIDIYQNENSNYMLTYDDGTKTTTSFIDESFLTGKDKYGAFLSGNSGLIEINTPTENGKNLLLIKDSYANCFIPLIADEFETVYVIDLRYYNIGLSTFIDEHDISDITILYNADSAATDMNLRKITL